LAHSVDIFDSTQLGKNGLAEYKLQKNKEKILEGHKYSSAPIANNIGNFESFKSFANVNDKGDMVGFDNHGQELIQQTLRNASATSRLNPRLLAEALGMIDIKKGNFKDVKVGNDMAAAFEKLFDSNAKAFGFMIDKLPREFTAAMRKTSKKIEEAMKKGTKEGYAAVAETKGAENKN